MTTTDKSRADALTGPYSTRHRSIGDWLWCELMDYCTELGMPPADNDRLFAIVDLARAAWDPPVEQHEAAPADAIETMLRVLMGCVNAYEKATGIGGWYAERIQESCNALLKATGSNVRFGISGENPIAQPAPSAPLEGAGNGTDDFAHELWAAAQLAPSEGISDGVQRIVAALSRAPRTEVAGALLSGDARECLMDVVSHHCDFVNACKVMHFDAINDDSDAYWEKQIDVLNRMKAQAERALSEPSADAAAAPADERAATFEWWLSSLSLQRRALIGDVRDARMGWEAGRAAALHPAAAAGQEAVAWVRKHPDTGKLSGDWLWNDVIEQCRKDSGVWFPLGYLTAPPAQVATRPGLTENERSAIKQGLQLAESMGYPGVASILRAILEGAKHE